MDTTKPQREKQETIGNRLEIAWTRIFRYSTAKGRGWGIAVDESGNVFFTDYAHAKVWKYRLAGR